MTYLDKIKKTVKAVIEKSSRCESDGELWLDTADVSKILKMRLKLLYPCIKFSVTSDKYSMGSSISVRWTDGPCEADVNDMLSGYRMERFDGMIDMATSCKAWLCPDGSITTAYVQGTTDSNGYISEFIADPPEPGAVLCYGGPDGVHGQRELSVGPLRWAVDKAFSYFGELANVRKPVVEVSEYSKCGIIKDIPTVQVGNRWLEQLLYGYARCFDYTTEPYKQVRELGSC